MIIAAVGAAVVCLSVCCFLLCPLLLCSLLCVVVVLPGARAECLQLATLLGTLAWLCALSVRPGVVAPCSLFSPRVLAVLLAFPPCFFFLALPWAPPGSRAARGWSS